MSRHQYAIGGVCSRLNHLEPTLGLVAAYPFRWTITTITPLPQCQKPRS